MKRLLLLLAGLIFALPAEAQVVSRGDLEAAIEKICAADRKTFSGAPKNMTERCEKAFFAGGAEYWFTYISSADLYNEPCARNPDWCVHPPERVLYIIIRHPSDFAPVPEDTLVDGGLRGRPHFGVVKLGDEQEGRFEMARAGNPYTEPRNEVGPEHRARWNCIYAEAVSRLLEREPPPCERRSALVR